MEEGRALLVDYFRRQGDTWAQVRYVEEPFRLELGRYTLVGTLDRVDELPDGTLHFVDYKRARTPPQMPDTLQLDVYQLSLAAKTGRLAERIVFEYLARGAAVLTRRGDLPAARTVAGGLPGGCD
jgi:RecB family exonuclease